MCGIPQTFCTHDLLAVFSHINAWMELVKNMRIFLKAKACLLEKVKVKGDSHLIGPYMNKAR